MKIWGLYATGSHCKAGRGHWQPSLHTFTGPMPQAEHSMELHMPYIMHVMRGQPFTLVPIMVGALPYDRWAGAEGPSGGGRGGWGWAVCHAGLAGLAARNVAI